MLLAAAYTYYKHRHPSTPPGDNNIVSNDNDDNNNNNNDDLSVDGTSRTRTNSSHSQFESARGTTAQEHLSRLTRSARRGGSDLAQQAIFRCTSDTAVTTDTDTSYNRNSSGRTARSSRRRPDKAVASVPLMDQAGGVGVHSDSSTSGVMQQSALDIMDDVFRPHVREEWINAVFGTDFFAMSSSSSSYQAPTQGVGLSGIPSYVTYPVTIAGGAANTKVGVTISRFPLGLYVRKVLPGSEAFFAGISPDSILVDVSGMAMLVEPSRQALERLWQYEGHFQESTANNDDVLLDPRNADGGVVPHGNVEKKRAVREPVALTFIKNGELYTVLMLSNPPWGISWAPCGNFPLVKRAYSLAADAGVRPGSLVAAVNGKSFREMDHAATALELRDLFQSGQEIHMTLCFTPAAARTGHYERLSGLDGKRKANQPKPRVTLKTNDGVEVKFHPWEYAIGGLCSPDTTLLDTGSGIDGAVQELADRVTAGLVEAPSGLSPRKRSEMKSLSRSSRCPPKVYGPCPTLSSDDLLEKWDPVDALLFCLQFHNVNYDEDNYVAELSKRADKSQIEILQSLTLNPNAAEMVGTFLLQFISLICAPDHDDSTLEKDEMKPEFFDTTTTSPSRKNANELTAMLLKLSRRNEGFCQRLYFLLRSYISTLETRRPSVGKDVGSRNLMALLNCLELLRFAEKQLADRVISSKLPFSGRPSLTDESVASSLAATSVSNSSPDSIPSPPPGVESSPLSAQGSSPEKKGFLGFLRKKQPRKEAKGSFGGGLRNSRSLQKRQNQNTKTTVDEIHRRSEVSMSLAQSPSVMYENMSDFLGELDNICSTIERSLQKSFRQKIAEWALQPWSETKDSALAKVTADMRESLRQARDDEPQRAILVNPVESTELLSSIEFDQCYILPSAHFPLLLTFNVSEQLGSDSIVGRDRIYRTKVELESIRGSSADMVNRSFVVHGALAGTICESGGSSSTGSDSHVWDKSNTLSFDTRSSWGAPQTLSLRLSSGQVSAGSTDEEVGFCWVDLSNLWLGSEAVNGTSTATCLVKVYSLHDTATFDEHGDLPSDPHSLCGSFELKLKVTTETIDVDSSQDGVLSRRRMLLYKHDDDLRQDAFAVQCIKTCDNILRASGLDMKMLTFQCIPVGTKRGFCEWIPSSVPLSEICQPFAGSILGNDKRDTSDDDSSSPSMLSKAGLTKFESLRRLGGQQNDSLPRLGGASTTSAYGSFANNPIQDYLRSVAYDAESPYLIRKIVMDTYVKSCAGYSVITYILGIGDRHLDNLLLHSSGSFFHCDFSFILGIDPKTYLPMRITDDMIQGMGGKGSDNYAKFLSLMGAAFLALRRADAVRILLSMVRLMEASYLPDISENQTTQESIRGLRERLRLDLRDDQAVAFIEQLVETSLSTKMWIAVDAIHSIGKKF
jgi:hypothetical protein